MTDFDVLDDFNRNLHIQVKKMIFDQHILPQSIVGCLAQEIYNIHRTCERYPELYDPIIKKQPPQAKEK